MKFLNSELQTTIESLTSRPSFLATCLAIGILSPPYVSRGFSYEKSGEIISYLLSHSWIGSFSPFYPLFQLIPIALVFGLIFFGNRIRRIFSFYAGLNFLLSAILQSFSTTELYGFGIVTGNFILILLVSLLWFLESWSGRNAFSSPKPSFLQFLVVPLAIVSFWFPINLETMQPDFRISRFWDNLSGLTFCMMATVYLAVLLFYYPRVNFATLRITSLVGMILGFWNLLLYFGIQPEWKWMGVLHLPLSILSLTGFYLTRKKQPFS